MLPYPSGKLHMGHVRNYTINDALTHFMRMKGINVLMPMGWDAFGLPAENAAMANRVAPAKWTRENIDYMRKQCKAMGWAFDWSRELATCDPAYYRWNQWFFLRLREKGVIYKKSGLVNWDPVDMTVLANEQVIDGRGWRTGALVEKREIPMWYMRITEYADELLDSLDGLGWPEQVKQMQRNWIGRSDGVEFVLPYAPETARRMNDGKQGPEGLHHARRHDHGRDLRRGGGGASARRRRREGQPAARGLHRGVQARRRAGSRARDDGEEGHAHGPVRAESDHRRAGRGVGRRTTCSWATARARVMAVPGHDERDFAFAKKYGLPIAQVIDVDGKTYSTDAWQPWYAELRPQHQFRHGYDGLDGKGYDGGDRRGGRHARRAGPRPPSACSTACATGASRASATGARRSRSSSARSAATSRCRTTSLPVVLPEDLVPDGTGSPLAKTPSFYETKCPKCGGAAKRDTDTMDTFVDSSWYYMRYCMPGREDHGRRARAVLDADGPVHRRHRARDPAPALRALLDQGDARPGPR